MQFIKLGYEPAQKVLSFKQIKADAEELLLFVDKKHEGQYEQAYAVSHCQVSERPFAFFVVNSGFVTNDNVKQKHMLFPHRIIINPEILEKPDTHEVTLPFPDKDGKQQIVKTPNIYRPDEACMSFQHRAPKKVMRFYKIKVRYQIPWLLGMRTITEWCDGLKAHVFQHETDHANGKNIFYIS
jgi:peptide deformylase